MSVWSRQAGSERERERERVGALGENIIAVAAAASSIILGGDGSECPVGPAWGTCRYVHRNVARMGVADRWGLGVVCTSLART
jgi:hypothetical protein